MTDGATIRLFSYGTLQQPEVQRSTCGRLLDGAPDSLPGFATAMVEITDAAVVAASGKRLRLTEKEAAILKFLYRAGGKPVPRQILLNEVWGYNSAVTTHTLETHIYRLRQKIEPDPTNSRLLLTEGGGYRLDPAAGVAQG